MIGFLPLRQEQDDLALDVLGGLLGVRVVMTAAGAGQGRGRRGIGGRWIAGEGGVGQTPLARGIFEAGEHILPNLPRRGMVQSDDACTLGVFLKLYFHLDPTTAEAKEGLYIETNIN